MEEEEEEEERSLIVERHTQLAVAWRTAPLGMTKTPLL